MKKTLTQLSIALLVIISLCATIHLNTVSPDIPVNQTDVLKSLTEEAPVESILPEVQVVKTVLHKFIEL